MAILQEILTQRDCETYARLTAPSHYNETHFSEHRTIEGYFENRAVPDFMGSDRLLKIDTVYGTVQMGYDPKREQSFLFANIKTSIFDTAPSRHQREVQERQMMRVQKTGTQNTAYSAKRRGASAVVLYKAENKPWSRQSVAPYMNRANLETLKKTMPFLDRSGEHSDRASIMREQKALGYELAQKMRRGAYGEIAEIRAKQTELLQRQNDVNALLYRKETNERLFFRRLNIAIDLQKHEMFEYYRGSRLRAGRPAKEEPASAANSRDEDQDE